MKRYVKVLPLSEPLCRPDGKCTFQHKCQRYLQQHSGAQKLGDFTDQHYVDLGMGEVRCRMFVRIEYQDTGAPPPRHFKHWTDR